MNLKFPLFILLVLLGLTSCSKKTTTFWVGGVKTPCSTGAGKTQCLTVYKGDNLDNAGWQNFSAPIEGFEFEEGYYQQIEVEEKKLKAKDVPADGSSIKYTLKKVIQKDVDNRAHLAGDWYAVKVDGSPIPRMYKSPTLNIDFDGLRMSGSDGCNNFTSAIQDLSVSKIKLGAPAVTKKMCKDMTMADKFDATFSKVALYELENDQLTFYDADKNPLVTFIPGIPESTDTSDDLTLSGSWVSVKINGHTIPKSIVAPKIMVDVEANQFSGNDGCNDFGGTLAQVDDKSVLNFGKLALTQKMCPEMLPGEEFNEAIASTASYKIENKMLYFYNDQGKEVAVFIPAQ